MDPITLAFYAIVCAGLSAAAPKLPGLPIRLGVGAGVGILAATILPFIKDVVGVY